jgi:hypothetical protein
MMPTSPGRVRIVLVSLVLAAGGCSVSESDVPPWMRGPHWRFVWESSRDYDSDFVAIGAYDGDGMSTQRFGDAYGSTENMGPSYSGASPSGETPVKVQVFPGNLFIVKTPNQDFSLYGASSVVSVVEQNAPPHPREGWSQVVPVWARYDMPPDGVWYGAHSSPDDVASVADALIQAGYLIELDVDYELRQQLIGLGPYWSRIEPRVHFVTAEFAEPGDLSRSAPPDGTSTPDFDDRMGLGSDTSLTSPPNPAETVPGVNDPFPGFGSTTVPAFGENPLGSGGTSPGLADSFAPLDGFGTGGSMPAQNPFGNNPFGNNPFGTNTTDLPADLRALFGDQGSAATQSVLFSDDDLKPWQSLVFVIDIHSQNSWGDFAQSQVTNATGRLTAEQKGETVVNFWVTLQKFAAGSGLPGDSLESLITTALGKKSGLIYVMTDRDLSEEAVATLRNENQAGTRIEVRFFDDLFQATETKNLENLATATGGGVAHYKQRLAGQ